MCLNGCRWAFCPRMTCAAVSEQNVRTGKHIFLWRPPSWCVWAVSLATVAEHWDIMIPIMNWEREIYFWIFFFLKKGKCKRFLCPAEAARSPLCWRLFSHTQWVFPSSTFKVTHMLTGCCVFVVLLLSWSTLWKQAINPAICSRWHPISITVALCLIIAHWLKGSRNAMTSHVVTFSKRPPDGEEHIVSSCDLPPLMAGHQTSLWKLN